MGLLEEQLKMVLRPGMIIPEPLRLLYKWIEDNKYYRDMMDDSHSQDTFWQWVERVVD